MQHTGSGPLPCLQAALKLGGGQRWHDGKPGTCLTIELPTDT
jgi:hypothetical protein